MAQEGNRAFHNKLLTACMLALLLFGVPPGSLANMLPDGHKNVEYAIRIQNADAFPNYLFILHLEEPRPIGWGGYVILEDEEDFGTNWPGAHMYSPQIYAIENTVFDENEISQTGSRAEEARLRRGLSTSEESAKGTIDYFKNNKNLIPADIQIDPVYSIRATDPREKITDVFKVVSIESGKFHMVKVKRTEQPTRSLPYFFWFPVLPAMAFMSILAILGLRKYRGSP